MRKNRRAAAFAPPSGWGGGAQLTIGNYSGTPQVAIDAAGNGVMALVSRPVAWPNWPRNASKMWSRLI